MKFDLTKFTSFKKCSVICESVSALVFYCILFLNVGLLDYTFAQGKIFADHLIFNIPSS